MSRRFGSGSVVHLLPICMIAWNYNCSSGDLGVVYVLGYCVLGARGSRFGRICPNTIILLRVLISNGNK